MNPRRIVLGILVVGLWAGAMLLLFERERGGEVVPMDSPPPVDGSVAVEPFRASYDVFSEGRDGARRVGGVELERSAEARHGVAGERSRVDAEAPLRLRGEVRDFRVDGTMWRPLETPGEGPDAAGEVPLAEVTFQLRWRDGEIRLVAALRDGALRGEVTADGETREIDVPVPDDVLIESGVGTNVGLSQSFSRRLARLDPGQSVRFTSFDPLTLGKSTARATCVAEETWTAGKTPVPAKVIEIAQGTLSTRVWLDPDGELLRATTPLGLRIERRDAAATGDGA